MELSLFHNFSVPLYYYKVVQMTSAIGRDMRHHKSVALIQMEHQIDGSDFFIIGTIKASR